MTIVEICVLGVVFLAISVLYSSVGHGGASGYLAAMALAGTVPIGLMKPTALSLNIVVATLATVRFARVGGFSWRLFAPFAATSIPCAFLGGVWQLDPTNYKRVLGLLLLVTALPLLLRQPAGAGGHRRRVPIAAGLLIGAVIGLVSGLIGVGGGIFLSPILLLACWADTRQTAGVSAAFILVNSVAGLLGHFAGVQQLPAAVGLWAAAVAVGGFIGSGLGSRRFGRQLFRRALAVVLIVAGIKMFLSAPPEPTPPNPPTAQEAVGGAMARSADRAYAACEPVIFRRYVSPAV